MRFLKYILAAAILSCLTFNSSAELNDYQLEIKDFTSLKVNDNINVIYYSSPDSAGIVKFSCTKEMAPILTFTNNKSELTISLGDDYDSDEVLPTVTVYSTKLEKVENGSDSTTIHIKKNALVDSFKARVVGNGSIIIDEIETSTIDLSVVTGKGHVVASSGTVFKAKYSDVGTGTIEAGGIKASQVSVKLFGTGTVDCSASESITIYGTGSGTVYYSGNPQKVSNRSVGIKAVKIETK